MGKSAASWRLISDSELTSGWSGEEGLVLVVGIPSSGELDVNLTQPRPLWWRFFSSRVKNCMLENKPFHHDAQRRRRA